MKMDDVVSKFKSCCRYFVNQILEANQDKAISMVLNLEKVNNAGSFVNLPG
jgi:hypothetical protein